MPEYPLAPKQASASPAGHTIMFWVLTVLAMAIFAPAVLVPIWVETEEIREHGRSVAAVVGDLEAQVKRNDRRIEAIRADPLVNERIIRRELNYRADDEQVVYLGAAELAGLELVLPDRPGMAKAEPPDHRPAWLMTVNRWLPAWPWRKLFAESPNRTVLLMMAGGLLVAAFVLYGPAASRGIAREG